MESNSSSTLQSLRVHQCRACPRRRKQTIPSLLCEQILVRRRDSLHPVEKIGTRTCHSSPQAAAILPMPFDHVPPRNAIYSSALCASPKTLSGHQPVSKHYKISRGTSLLPHSFPSRRMESNSLSTLQSPRAQSVLYSFEKKKANNFHSAT